MGFDNAVVPYSLFAAEKGKVAGLELKAAQAQDSGASFVLGTLADALGVASYTPCDGTETWEGDVANTVYEILREAGVIDRETDELRIMPVSAAAEAGR